MNFKICNKIFLSAIGSIMLFVMLSYESHSQTLKEIASIDITKKGIIKAVDTRTGDFANTKKVIFGFFSYIEMSELFKEYVKPELKPLYLIKAENDQGEYSYFTFLEAEKLTSTIPPMLILEKVSGKTGDTVTIRDIKGKTGKVDLDELEKEVKKLFHFRIIMQIKDKDEIKRRLRNNTVIFPQDITTYRWINNVKRMKLYLIQ